MSTKRQAATTLVVGAGPTGLAATFGLASAGRTVVLVDANSYVGGLAASFTYGDQIFDVGPHGLSLPKGEIRDLVHQTLGDRLYSVPLVRRMYRDGVFYQHPFSAPDFWARATGKQRLRASSDYLIARIRRLLPVDPPERSFEDWASRRYGAYLYDYYIRSYSAKSWGERLQKLSPLWAEQRLYDPRPRAVLGEFIGRGNQTTEQVQLYCDGGIGALPKALAERCQRAGASILLDTPVTSLRRFDGLWHARLGDSDQAPWEAFEEIIWTGPVEDVARLVAATDPEHESAVVTWSRALRYRGAVFVYLDLNRPPNLTFTSCYVADPTLPFCRIYEPGWYLRGAERSQSRALCLEYHTEETSGGPEVPLDDRELSRLSVAALSKVPGYEDVSGRATPLGVVRIDKHYPLLDEPTAISLANLLPYLAGKGIVPAGRAGLFRYVNMDIAMEMGLRAADTVLQKASFDAVNELGMDRTFREAVVRSHEVSGKAIGNL
jgi:protoporphyrinogen oxidase